GGGGRLDGAVARAADPGISALSLHDALPISFGVRDEILEQQVELVGGELAVLLPPDRLLGAGVADDELVLGAAAGMDAGLGAQRSEEHTSELQSRGHLVCRLLPETKKNRPQS